MTKPTTREFEQAKRIGDSGETTVALYLARNAEVVAARLGTTLSEILVKLDARHHHESFEERVGNVTLRFVPTPKSEQASGDLVILGEDGRQRFLEVKSEQWLLKLSGKPDYSAKETPNIAFETHDIISPAQYETLWTGGKTDAHGLLVHPESAIGYDEPTLPEWYKVPGGHLKTSADWLVHYFVPSQACLVLSLGNIRRDLRRGRFDRTKWFASCTAQPGTRATCRRPGDPNIAYYTVGKRLNVQSLVADGRALLLGEPRQAG